MATLEVHNSRGRVEFVSIAPTVTALVGSDPKCDVVFDDPQVLPIHGRLSFKRGALRLQTTPQAQPFEVNGKKMLSAKLKLGDEVRIGGCRFFVMTSGEASSETEKTRYQAPPEAVSTAAAAARPSKPQPPPRRAEPSWLHDLEMAPPSFAAEIGEVEAPATTAKRTRGRSSPDPRSSEPASPGPIPMMTWWQRAIVAVTGEDRAPGEERIFTSPMVLSLAATLLMLMLMSGLLWKTIARRTADSQYLRAVETFNDGDYLNAIQRFDQFLEKQPGDARGPKARAFRALATVRQFTAGGAPAWGEGLDAAEAMIQDQGSNPAFDDARADLAEDVLKIAEGLSERARAAIDDASLARAESAAALHRELTGDAADKLQARSRLPAKLATARAAILKGHTRHDALNAMTAALKEGSASKLYAIRDRLVASYPDQATDGEVVKRLTQANELLKRAVRFDPSTRPAELGDRPEPLGPPTSLVLRSATTPNATESDGIVFALAEGLAYGLNEGNGKPLWQRPVGLSAAFAPQPIAGSPPTAILVDARHNELVRVDARTGATIWRLPFEGPINDPPLVLGNDLYQALRSGRLVQIDLKSGEVRGTLEIGVPLTRTPAADELGQHLYVLGDRANLFVLQRDPFGCVAVEYLGHEAGSIPIPPTRLGHFLIVATNDSWNTSRWDVFVLGEGGARLRRVQQIAIAGWTWDAPAASGSVIWAVGDRGGLTAYAIGSETEAVPLRKIADVLPDNKAKGPAFALAKNEHEVWLASGRTGGFDLSLERGTIDPLWRITDAEPARGPIQRAGKLAVMTHQPTVGRGVALRGIEPGDGTIVWTTILGAPWPAHPRSRSDAAALETLGLDGKTLELSSKTLRSGGFVEQTLPAPGSSRLPEGPFDWIARGDVDVLVPDRRAERLYVRAQGGAWKDLRLPAPLAAPPVYLGAGLLLVGQDGLITLVDPKHGTALVDPYVTPFDRSKPANWSAAVPLDANSFLVTEQSGRLLRIAREEKPRPRLVVVGDEISLGSALLADVVATDSAVIAATADGHIRALAVRDFSPLGTWDLAAPRALGPIAVGNLVLVADSNGDVLAIDKEGRRLWSAERHEGPILGTPLAQGEFLRLMGRDGTLHKLTASTGETLERIKLDLLPAGGPIALESGSAIPVAPGTLRVLEAASP